MGLESNPKNIFTPIHDSLIKTAWKMFLDKPVLGHGRKMFRLKCDYLNMLRVITHAVLSSQFLCTTFGRNRIDGCSFLIGLYVSLFM